MIKVIIISAVLALVAGSPAPAFSPIQIKSGFEFLAALEGKVFVRPIYNPAGGTDNLNFQEAVEKCASAGYRIATIESAAQNAAAGESTCGFDVRWAWIDGIDIVTQNSYFSINTGKNLTYFSWSRWGQRPIIGKDDRTCIRISCNNRPEGPSMWDVPCDQSYLTVICEVPISK